MAITDDQLAAWDAVCQAATPGPWEYRRMGGIHMDGTVDAAAVMALIDGLWHRIIQTSVERPDRAHTASDMVFVATAREAMPALIKEVRSLRKAIEWIATGGFRDPVAYARAVAEAHGIPLDEETSNDEEE